MESISSKSDTIQGTFKTKVVYPAGEQDATPTTLFSTEVPTFWDNDGADGAAPQRKASRSTPRTRTRGTSLLAEILLGFGPTLLLRRPLLCSWRVGRSRAAAGSAGSGNFGRSQARRVDPTTIQVTFDDVAGIDEAKAELTEIVDFLQDAGALRAPRRADTARRAAVRTARHRQDARRPRGGGRGARGLLLDRGLGVHRGDRRSRRRARARPVRQGQGGGAVDHLHRRARCRRPLAAGVGRHHRRQRRARADARPDPDRDGRLRVDAGGRRDRRHQPPGDPRPRPAASGTVRPPRRRAAARQARPAEDPRGSHPLDAAGRRRRPRGARGDDAGDGRRRPRQPRQRGGVAGRSPQPRQGADGRLHRLAREDPARRAARDRARPRGPRADRLPRVGPRARRDAEPGSRPGAQGLDHPARPGARGHALDA